MKSMFQTCELMFKSFEHKFISLEHKFRTSEHKLLKVKSLFLSLFFRDIFN